MTLISRAAAPAAALLLFACPAAIGATWIAGSSTYGTPANWDTGTVPCDELTAGVNTADIDGSVTVNQDVAACTVSDLALGDESTLLLSPATDYQAAAADILGRIDGDGGDLTASGSLGPASQVFADAGSVITLDSAALATTSPENTNKNFLLASGAGSLINLFNATTLDASYDSVVGSSQFHRINATANGTINLSGLTSITGPVDPEDRLLIDASGSGSINLGSLNSVTAGGFVQIDASDGSTLDLPALSSLASTVFVAGDGGTVLANTSAFTYEFTSRPNLNTNLMQASGNGLIDLSGATALNLNFDSVIGSSQFQRITATGNGGIDLSGVATITGPVDDEDRLLIDVADTANIDFSGLSSTDAGGFIQFEATLGASLTLPNIDSLSSTTFSVGDGSSITADTSSFTYLFTTRENLGSTLMQTTGSGQLNLGGATALDLSFDSVIGSSQFSQILASGNSLIDLSGVTSITGPVDPEDRNILEVNDSAQLLLDSLETTDAGGFISMSAGNGAALDLPSLQSTQALQLLTSSGGSITANGAPWTYAFTTRPNLNSTILQASGTGSLIQLGGLTNIDASFDSVIGSAQWSQIQALSGGIVDLSSVTHIEGPVDDEDFLRIEFSEDSQVLLDSLESTDAGGYIFVRVTVGATLSLPAILSADSMAMYAESGSQIIGSASPWTYAFTSRPNSSTVFLRAMGDDSLLDMSSVTALDSGFNSVVGSAQTNTVEARDNGVVDLRGVRTITLPFDAEDWLFFDVFNGGRLILGALDDVGGNGNGLIDVGPAGAALEFPLSLDISDNMSLTAGANAEIDVTGDFSFRHTAETDFDIEAAIVTITGANPLDIEVGGENLGTGGPAGLNFGIGQLVIGSATETVNARLIDGVDNGNGDVCAAAGIDREALYLYGFDVGVEPDGLRVLNGSTLDLGGLDVYAGIGGVLTHLNPLITPGVPFPYDEGFIALDTVFDIDMDGVPDSTDNCVLEPNANQADTDGDGYGNACDGDLNGDLFVNGLDLGQFKAAFFSTPASPNWNPNADFNNDLQVNAIDLGILKLLFFLPPGPACPVPGP